MSVIALLFGLALAGSAISLSLRAAALPRLDAAERLARIQSYGFVADADGLPRGLKAAMNGWAERLGGLLERRIGALDEPAVRKELVAAGVYDLSPLTFIGYRAFAAVGVGALAFEFGASSHQAGAQVVLMAAIGGAAGWVLPSTILHRRATKRLDEIEYALPELIDLLVVTVEAGLGFSSAMKTAAGRIQGPLGDELRLTLQENNMGLAITDAMANMLERAETPSMRSFVRSVLQGETLGVSIGTIMRNLAVDMRKRRRAAAEERAQKAPIKMLFPLVFLIFPPMFIVLLFPAGMQFVQAFSGG
jgi:tight adherence protein C